jgi:Putative DNA-binding domain
VIPKPLNEIEWSDIEALRDSGREEDDTIEYKGSFSGGADFLSFTDSQRAKAIEGVVREALAFLNGRGGDVVIGVREAKNDHPKIEEITPVAKVVATVDRLAQSLAAVIEPTQSILGVKAILMPDSDEQGVIVIRAPSSLRAPHRYMGNKECYIRRGRESVPMPMDEVQDLTIRRADTLSERITMMSEQFRGLDGNTVGRNTLSAHRVHFRCCFVPFSRQQLALDDGVLNAFRGYDPVLTSGQSTDRNDVAFRNLEHSYRPVLRGMTRETLVERARSENDFMYAAKTISADGMMRTDFACRTTLSEGEKPAIGFHDAWIAGYFANTIVSIRSVVSVAPWLSGGFFRVAVYAGGQIEMGSSSSRWSKNTLWPARMITIPDFEIQDDSAFAEIFLQLQRDVASIAGLTNTAIYTISSDE